MRTLLPLHHRRHGRRRDVSLLLGVPSFRDADPRLLAELAAHSDRLRLPPGRTLVRAGETARALIAIVAGEATAAGGDGRLSVLRAGDEIGAGELLCDRRHAATVVATGDVEVVVVNGPAARWALRDGGARGPDGSATPAPHPAVPRASSGRHASPVEATAQRRHGDAGARNPRRRPPGGLPRRSAA